MQDHDLNADIDSEHVRAARSVSLLAAAAVILVFWFTDDPLLSEAARKSGEAGWIRTAWMALLLVSAGLTRWAPSVWHVGVALLAGGGSAIAMTRLSALTGGTAGPNFAWLVAFPFIAAVVAPEVISATVLTGVLCVLGGASIAIAHHGLTLIAALWTLTLVVAAVLGVLASFRHITARRLYAVAQKKQFEADAALRFSAQRQADLERIAHMSQLAVVGEMTAGIAHDLRNYFGALTLALPMLREESDSDDSGDTWLVIDAALTGATGILAGMNGLARPSGHGADRCDVVRVLASCRRLTRHRWRMVVDELVVVAPAGPIDVAIGETPLSQVLVNLIVNAVDACEERQRDGAHAVVVTLRLDAKDVHIDVDDSGQDSRLVSKSTRSTPSSRRRVWSGALGWASRSAATRSNVPAAGSASTRRTLAARACPFGCHCSRVPWTRRLAELDRCLSTRRLSTRRLSTRHLSTTPTSPHPRPSNAHGTASS